MEVSRRQQVEEYEMIEIRSSPEESKNTESNRARIYQAPPEDSVVSNQQALPRLSGEGRPTRVIPCYGCRQQLMYPEGTYLVKCPSCQTTTATQVLCRSKCRRCNQFLIYPRTALTVLCQCGTPLINSLAR